MATISRPDSTSETFPTTRNRAGRTAGLRSPAAATLLAQAGGTYKSPNGNATTIQPDWLGMGLAGNVIDALGDDQLFDRNANGLATVTVDQVNRNTQFSTTRRATSPAFCMKIRTQSSIPTTAIPSR